MDRTHAGRDLIAQKKALGHGNFLPWIEAEFGMSERTARNFMSVFEKFGSNRHRIADLSPQALYLLAAPSTPEPVRQEVLTRAGAAGKAIPIGGT